MKYDFKLYLCDDEGQKFFGRGPLELLIKIDEHQSINKAASSMYLSYNKALEMIKKAEKGFNYKLVIKKSGGINGGGSQLTPEALEIIKKYRLFEDLITNNTKSAFDNLFLEKENNNGTDTF